MALNSEKQRKNKYDFSCEFDENGEYSINDLCVEISCDSEILLSKEANMPGIENIKYKFYHSNKTGIGDKLKENFDFDLKAIGEKSKKEKFDMLRLMKYLYFLEKLFNSSLVRTNEKYKRMKMVSVLDILAKPRLENISESYVLNGEYKDELEATKNDISKLVESSDVIYDKLNNINALWNCVMHKIFDYVFSDRAMRQPTRALMEMERINNQLVNNIIVRLPKHLPEKACGEHIMEGFYKILVSHSFLCEDNDRETINNEYAIRTSINKDYAVLVECNDFTVALQSILDLSKKYLSGKSDDEGVKLFLDLVSYNKTIEYNDIKKYVYALNAAPKVIKCLELYFGKDFSECIDLNLLVAIIQEIIYIRENKVSVTNDFYKYNNKNISLKLLTQSSDKIIPEIVKEAWVKCIENRIALNYGQYELIEIKRKIENNIFIIKQFIYSYHNIDDVKFVSDFLFNFVSDIIISSDRAFTYALMLFNKISEKISEQIKQYRVDVAEDCVNLMAFFKLIFINKNLLEEKIINEISSLVIKEYQNDITLIKDGVYKFVLNKNDVEQDYSLSYRIDKKDNTLCFLKFRRLVNDGYSKKAIDLGLEQFFEEK